MKGIVKLLRQNDTMSLWGERADGSRVWLGSPGWWGSMTRAEREEVQAFLAPLRALDAVPTHPGEWALLSDFRGRYA